MKSEEVFLASHPKFLWVLGNQNLQLATVYLSLIKSYNRLTEITCIKFTKPVWPCTISKRKCFRKEVSLFHSKQCRQELQKPD